LACEQTAQRSAAGTLNLRSQSGPPARLWSVAEPIDGADTESLRILAKTARREPTKLSKPGFAGFEGGPSAESPKIGARDATV
jgi:hypothetical protein